MRRGQHLQGGEHQRGLGEASYSGLCWVKTVRRCSAGLVHNLRMRQQFVDAYFCRCLTFVHANILLMPMFCRRQYFVDTYILSTPKTFVDPNIFSTPIFCRHLTFIGAYVQP
jgi:hypothetical protein